MRCCDDNGAWGALAPALLACAPLLLSACGGGGGSETNTEPPALVEDEARTESTTLQPDNPTLVTLTSGEGVAIDLQVPAGAVSEETAITVTPLQAVRQLDTRSGMLAGVRFRPAGLVFAQPATLTLTPPALPATALQALGFTGNGQHLHERPFTNTGSGLEMTVLHFSGVAVVEEGALASDAEPADEAQAIETALARYLQTFDANDRATAVGLMRGWFNDAIRPQLAAAEQDRNGFLEQAVTRFVLWKGLAAHYGLESELSTELTDGDDLSTAAFDAAIHADNEVCRQRLDVAPAVAVLAWQNLADWAGFGILPRFELEHVINNLCLHVVITDVRVPTQIGPGDDVAIGVDAAIEFDTNARITDVPLEVIISSTEDVTPEQGLTDATGTFTARGRLVDGSPELRLSIVVQLPQIVNVFDRQLEIVPGAPALDLGVKLPGTVDETLTDGISVDEGDEVWIVGFARRGLGPQAGSPVSLNVDSGNGTLNDTSLTSDGEGRFSTEFFAGNQNASVVASFVDQGQRVSDSVTVNVAGCVLEEDQHCCPSQIAAGMVDCCNADGACACVDSFEACEAFQQ